MITLSDMDPDLEEWARAEAKRKNAPFYQVINEALEVLRLTREGTEKDEPQEVSAGGDASIRGPTPAEPAGGSDPSGPQGQTSPVLS